MAEANPNKRKAQQAATNAVRDGKLERRLPVRNAE